MESITSSAKKPKLAKDGRGRPTKTWHEKGDVAKWKEIKEFSETLMEVPREKLLLAVAKVMKKTGDKDLSDILEFTSFDKSRTKELMDKLNSKNVTVRQITPQSALSMLYDANLGKTAYIAVQRAANSCGQKVIPCYDRVRTAKSECYPPAQSISITDTCASVDLGAMLHLTADRIVENQRTVFDQEKENIRDRILTFTVAWGMDGSSGYSQYKQGYSNNLGAAGEDSSVFAITINPLRIYDGNKIYWNNATPQSYRFCRPLKIMFAKESKDLVLREYNFILERISQLQPYEIRLSNDIRFNIQFSLHFTIIDGKVLSFIQGTSNQSCPVCWSNPKDFNNVENLGKDKFHPKPDSMNYGLSCLHAYIRCLEYFIKIGYRMSFKQWQARAALQNDCKKEKLRIQKELWDELKLRVDYPNPCGGTSNDGNTARRAFQNYQTFARVLNINEDIVKGFRTILVALSSQFPINPQRFKDHCYSLYHKLMEQYNWYLLPSSIHKLLIHGADIIAASPLPVGMLAEDCAESRNKCYKFDKTHRSRKTSRKDTISDMLHRSLGTSDPVISSISLMRRVNIRKRKALPSEVIALLDQPPHDVQAVSHTEFDLLGTDDTLDCDVILDNEIEI